jgi:hypothetical protein
VKITRTILLRSSSIPLLSLMIATDAAASRTYSPVPYGAVLQSTSRIDRIDAVFYPDGGHRACHSSSTAEWLISGFDDGLRPSSSREGHASKRLPPRFDVLPNRLTKILEVGVQDDAIVRNVRHGGIVSECRAVASAAISTVEPDAALPLKR